MWTAPYKTYFILFLLFNKGVFSQRKSLFKTALEKETEKYTTDIDFKKIRAFFLKDQWDSTLVYSLRKTNTKSKETKLIDYYHFFRGASFKKKRITNEAKKEFSLISNDFTFNVVAQFYLGNCELMEGNSKKALTYYKLIENIPLSKLLGVTKTSIELNIAFCYAELTKYKEAEPYFLKALNTQEKEKDTTRLVRSYNNIASFYYRQNKRVKGEKYFKKAYDLSKSIDDFNTKLISTSNMIVVEEYKKNYKKALVYTKEMVQWNDSLNNQSKIYAVAQSEKEFAVKEKQKEVDILEVENKLKETQRNLFLYSAIALLLLLSVGIYFYREKVKTNKIIAAQKENLDALNATKDKLFSIVSHDLRSSVNALKTSNSSLLDNLASKNLTILESLLQKNSAIVNGAYSLLDNLLNWALLQTEQGYFNIEKLRLFFITEQVSYNYKPLLAQKELSFTNTVAKKDMAFADQESLKIVLRNLLDNAIKFSETNGSIKVYSENTDENYCDLIIEDTGLGMSDATRLKLLSDSELLAKKENEDIIGTGLGMQLCKQMIKKNNGKFHIESELGKGTKMIISLPKNA